MTRRELHCWRSGVTSMRLKLIRRSFLGLLAGVGATITVGLPLPARSKATLIALMKRKVAEADARMIEDLTAYLYSDTGVHPPGVGLRALIDDCDYDEIVANSEDE